MYVNVYCSQGIHSVRKVKLESEGNSSGLNQLCQTLCLLPAHATQKFPSYVRLYRKCVHNRVYETIGVSLAGTRFILPIEISHVDNQFIYANHPRENHFRLCCPIPVNVDKKAIVAVRNRRISTWGGNREHQQKYVPIVVVQVSEILSGMNEILHSACMTEMGTTLSLLLFLYCLHSFIHCIAQSWQWQSSTQSVSGMQCMFVNLFVCLIVYQSLTQKGSR